MTKSWVCFEKWLDFYNVFSAYNTCFCWRKIFNLCAFQFDRNTAVALWYLVLFYGSADLSKQLNLLATLN